MPIDSPAPAFDTSVVADPADWDGTRFRDPASFERFVTPSEIDELAAICASLEARGLGWDDTRREDFPFDVLKPLLGDTLRELREGRGFALLRGLPLAEWTSERAQLATWGLGTWLGEHVSQTAKGLRLVDVSDVTGDEPSPRQFRTSQELRLHVDPASDIVGLACIQDAKSGGESVLTSAIAVHNALAVDRPDLLELLYEGFHWHRFNEGRPQDGPYSRERVPVYARRDGRLSCRYVRAPIVAGQKDAGCPLGHAQIEALDAFDRLASSAGLRIAFRLQPGDLMLVNNLVVLHARTRFEDHEDAAHRRHLLRLWIEASPDFRPVPPILNYFNGGSCGIPYGADRTAEYDMAALHADPRSGGPVRLGV